MPKTGKECKNENLKAVKKKAPKKVVKKKAPKKAVKKKIKKGG